MTVDQLFLLNSNDDALKKTTHFGGENSLNFATPGPFPSKNVRKMVK